MFSLSGGAKQWQDRVRQPKVIVIEGGPMRAVVVPEYGGPDVLTLADLPEPEPGRGEVTIAVRFAGVNFTDVRNRIGDGLGVVPFVPGVEVAGTVRRGGDGGTGLRPGQAGDA